MHSPEKTPTQSFVLTLFHALRYVAVVLFTGIALATVFAAWTPDGSSDLFGDLARMLDLQRMAALTTPAPELSTPVAGVTPTASKPLPLIGLVAGHKGNDSGAVCPDGLTEAQVNLDIATRVKVGLEANGFQVDLLDEFDNRLEGYKAMAVVSIHNDSCEYVNELATGYKVAGAIDIGARGQSARLETCLTDRYAKRTSLTFHRGSVTRDMTQYHGFYEVADTTPVAIIETGFLNLVRKILTEQPEKVAQGVIDGILCFVLNEPVQPTPQPSP